MDTIVTSDIIPVDLNAFMYWNMKILAHLQGEIGNIFIAFSSNTDYILKLKMLLY